MVIWRVDAVLNVKCPSGEYLKPERIRNETVGTGQDSPQIPQFLGSYLCIRKWRAIRVSFTSNVQVFMEGRQLDNQ